MKLLAVAVAVAVAALVFAGCEPIEEPAERATPAEILLAEPGSAWAWIRENADRISKLEVYASGMRDTFQEMGKDIWDEIEYLGDAINQIIDTLVEAGLARRAD